MISVEETSLKNKARYQKNREQILAMQKIRRVELSKLPAWREKMRFQSLNSYYKNRVLKGIRVNPPGDLSSMGRTEFSRYIAEKYGGKTNA